MPVKKHLMIAAQVLMLALLPSAALAQQELLSDPEIYEMDHFRKQCQTAEFGSAFMTRLDINNDGIVDALSNHGELTCDGKKGAECNEDGCPYNFYLRAKEGGYFMIATARIYSYDFIKRFGNMVFVMKMHPRFCERTDDKPCEMTVRVRGGRFVTISKK
ncbi:hypothetical protein LH464_11705 [Neorhizobium sp. T786]|uniref:hypothetical protein n=1 Tax=Pseudorhizobium xiangyangii TaxID=2883104 RepID=UPI001CFF6269|nr:hypothetical protein [Neorhizobium xiangyangii]MCB5203135.1 hypothetical protein [Neorhizobium xiangyangii]